VLLISGVLMPRGSIADLVLLMLLSIAVLLWENLMLYAAVATCAVPWLMTLAQYDG
jgi:hypothetical protein